VKKVRSFKQLRQDLTALPHVIDIFNKGNLYLADYSQLDDLPLHGNFVFYSPQVLMSSSSNGLKILAILLRSSKLGVQTHLLQPLISSPGRWLYAKMQVAVADSQLHEFAYHLPLHQILENVMLASHNHFGEVGNEQHPLGRLLAPHFEGTLIVNWFSRHTLMRPRDSIVEQTFSVGRKGAAFLASKSSNFSLLHFPSMMERRGFPEGDSKLNYLFRDDGYKLWRALERYVYGVIRDMYVTDRKVMSDTKLQSWLWQSQRRAVWKAFRGIFTQGTNLQ